MQILLHWLYNNCYFSAKRSRVTKFQWNNYTIHLKNIFLRYDKYKKVHCLLIHGSSVFFVYILDKPRYLPKKKKKPHTCHVSKESDHVLYTCDNKCSLHIKIIQLYMYTWYLEIGFWNFSEGQTTVACNCHSGKKIKNQFSYPVRTG